MIGGGIYLARRNAKKKRKKTREQPRTRPPLTPPQKPKKRRRERSRRSKADPPPRQTRPSRNLSRSRGNTLADTLYPVKGGGAYGSVLDDFLADQAKENEKYLKEKAKEDGSWFNASVKDAFETIAQMRKDAKAWREGAPGRAKKARELRFFENWGITPKEFMSRVSGMTNVAQAVGLATGQPWVNVLATGVAAGTGLAFAPDESKKAGSEFLRTARQNPNALYDAGMGVYNRAGRAYSYFAGNSLRGETVPDGTVYGPELPPAGGMFGPDLPPGDYGPNVPAGFFPQPIQNLGGPVPRNARGFCPPGTRSCRAGPFAGLCARNCYPR